MKGRMEGRLAQRTIETETEVIDMVRARLMQGYAREHVVRDLKLGYGLDDDAVERALAHVDEEGRLERQADAREAGRATLLGAGAVLFIAVVGAIFGSSGVAGLSGLIAAGAIAVIVRELKRTFGQG